MDPATNAKLTRSEAMPVDRPSAAERLCAALVLRALARLRRGRLAVLLPSGEARHFGGVEPGGEAEIRVVRPAFFRKVALGGDVGFGESFTDGDWHTADLTAVLRLFIDNEEVMASRGGRPAWTARLRDLVARLARRNSPSGSQANIREHYDLGNEFFRLFLDETMTYSCAVFDDADEPLETAQLRKIHRLLDRARLAPGMHLLEIGSGWGAAAIEAARRHGVRVTTVTLSEEQLRVARERVREAGLEGRVAVELRDYRKIEGTYDRVLSIEMLEAVGHRYLGEFFAAVDRALKPPGLAVLQVITLPDQRYDGYRRRVDWIQKHIFPGGLTPSLTALCHAMTHSSALVVESLENVGPHYATTLARWRDRLLARRAEVAALGLTERFLRTFEYYFSYCEAGFASRYLNVLQLVLTRPCNATLSGPPPNRPTSC